MKLFADFCNSSYKDNALGRFRDIWYNTCINDNDDNNDDDDNNDNDNDNDDDNDDGDDNDNNNDSNNDDEVDSSDDDDNDNDDDNNNDKGNGSDNDNGNDSDDDNDNALCRTFYVSFHVVIRYNEQHLFSCSTLPYFPYIYITPIIGF